MAGILKWGVFVYLAFMVALTGCSPDERDKMIDKLEKEVARHSARTDSLVVEANALTERVQRLNARRDSLQTTNRKLISAMLRVQDATLEYHQGLIRQNIHLDKMRAELNLLKAEPGRLDTKVQLLRADIETLSVTLRKQYQIVIGLEEIVKKDL